MLSSIQQPALGEKQWEDLRHASPGLVCRRADVTYDPEGYYCVPFLNATYRVFPATASITGPEGDGLISNPEFVLLLLVYLLGAQEISLTGKWETERDLKDGNLFFRGPHALATKRLVERFGTQPHAFRAAGQRCGGQESSGYGDVALRFQAFPRIPVMCILWVADDEFPARVSFLFDPSITVHLPLDVILAFVRCLSKRLVEADKILSQ